MFAEADKGRQAFFSTDNGKNTSSTRIFASFSSKPPSFILAISMLDEINGGGNSKHEGVAQSLTLPKL